MARRRGEVLKQWSRARERCCMLISPPSACPPHSLLPPGLPPPRPSSRLRRSLPSSGPAAAARFLLPRFPARPARRWRVRPSRRRVPRAGPRAARVSFHASGRGRAARTPAPTRVLRGVAAWAASGHRGGFGNAEGRPGVGRKSGPQKLGARAANDKPCPARARRHPAASSSPSPAAPPAGLGGSARSTPQSLRGATPRPRAPPPHQNYERPT